MSPRPRPAVAALNPYQPGISRREQNIKHRLASNESPLGPSPQAKEAYAKAVNDIARYPPEGLVTLREALAAKHALNPERIVCGSGSDELLSLLAYAYLNQGDVALHTQHGFLVYPIVIRAAGAKPVPVPERERKVDVDALLEAVTQNHPKAIFIANPGNPTGTHLSRHDLERLRDNIPETCLLIVDAAYAEFADAHDYDEGFDLAAQAPNVAVLRTFSKAHGLAGLRVGWTYCSLDAADILNRLRSPFNVNAAAAAAAQASTQSDEHIANAVKLNAQGRENLRKRLLAIGLNADPSQGNFILARFPENTTPTKPSAHEADAFLRKRGIITRRMDVYGFPQALRISIAEDDAMRDVADALEEFLAEGATHS